MYGVMLIYIQSIKLWESKNNNDCIINDYSTVKYNTEKTNQLMKYILTK